MSVDPIRYPTKLYRDPLLMPTYFSLFDHQNIDDVVEGDSLLNLYIVQLDSEIFQNPPDYLSTFELELWNEDDWGLLCTQIVDESRKHGWCLVKFTEDTPIWKIYTPTMLVSWIPDEDNQKIGARFSWYDDMGNLFTENVLFDEAVVVKFREGNGKNIFAYPDITTAIWTTTIQYRQIRGQISFHAAKSFFKVFKIAPGADPAQAAILENKLMYVDDSTALSVGSNLLDDVKAIEDNAIEKMLQAAEHELQIFAGLTRLPLAFYLGERMSGGLSDVGEKTIMLKIDRKKEFLFDLFKPYVQACWELAYGIPMSEIEFPTGLSLEEIEEEQPNNQPQNPINNQNEVNS